MKALEEKTKQLSLDSAYTSEVDLESSHNTHSGTTSPKELYSSHGSTENSLPSSPKPPNKSHNSSDSLTSHGHVATSADESVVN
jgi:hypothetical protein